MKKGDIAVGINPSNILVKILDITDTEYICSLAYDSYENYLDKKLPVYNEDQRNIYSKEDFEVKFVKYNN